MKGQTDQHKRKAFGAFKMKELIEHNKFKALTCDYILKNKLSKTNERTFELLIIWKDKLSNINQMKGLIEHN